MTRDRYTSGAGVYDLVSGERPVYRIGRTTAIAMLGLRPGDRVLDLGCGTGLNHALLQSAVAPTGRVLGVDRSESMLASAARRIRRRGLGRVRLLAADATTLDPDAVRDLLGGPADAIIATYTLSIMDDPAEAWRRACAAARPEARVAIVDMREPHFGPARLLAPLARAFAGFGGSDLDAQPWRLLDGTAVDVRSASLRGGHIVVRVGTLAATDPAPSPHPEPLAP